MGEIRARRLVGVLDCCFSAATVVSFPRSKSFHIPKVIDPFSGFGGEGHVILTASQGTQESVELPELKHGAFTYHLLQGLKGEADVNQDNVVELWETWQYLEDKVSQTAKKLGNDQQPTISATHLTHNFPLTTYPLALSQPESGPEEPAESGPAVCLSDAHTVPGIPWIQVKIRRGHRFRISAAEITNQQFAAFVLANPLWAKNRISSSFQDGDYLKHWPAPDQYPRFLVAAKAFAQWVNGRLPTETEWMAAAAGAANQGRFDSDDALYPWGGNWDPGQCNHAGFQGQVRSVIRVNMAPVDTLPVLSLPLGASRWPDGGIHHLSGNVWEWVDDWVFETNDKNGAKEFVVEPVGPDQETAIHRMIKGGSFLADRLGCMISSRLWADPSLCAQDGGFRVVAQ